MAGRYAENTSVSSEASRAEIERILFRYGATGFGYMVQPSRAQIMFEIGNRRIRFTLVLPDRTDRSFTHTPERGRERTSAAAEQAYEQAVRQSWRALALVIKAKLEAVAAGITTIEDEFLAHTVLPSGATVGEWARPQIAQVYASGRMPELMPGMSDRG